MFSNFLRQKFYPQSIALCAHVSAFTATFLETRKLK
jgi:hypothetical protein